MSWYYINTDCPPAGRAGFSRRLADRNDDSESSGMDSHFSSYIFHNKFNNSLRESFRLGVLNLIK